MRPRAAGLSSFATQNPPLPKRAHNLHIEQRSALRVRLPPPAKVWPRGYFRTIFAIFRHGRRAVAARRRLSPLTARRPVALDSSRSVFFMRFARLVWDCCRPTRASRAPMGRVCHDPPPPKPFSESLPGAFFHLLCADPCGPFRALSFSTCDVLSRAHFRTAFDRSQLQHPRASNSPRGNSGARRDRSPTHSRPSNRASSCACAPSCRLAYASLRACYFQFREG